MAFISVEDLSTHIYAENIEAIVGDDDTLIVAAIDSAIEEAKGYLSGFDRDSIFAATGSSRNPLLLIFVKDIAIWHLITLCNAGTERSLRQDRYERAVSWLKSVQKGNTSPDLPRIDVSGETPGIISYGSNTKRIQHF